MRIKFSKGISIVETIIYVAILTIVLFVIAIISLSLIKSHRSISLTRELESNAAFAMERMVREIRLATSINEGLSSFNTTPGTLTLQGVESGNPYSIRFDVSASQLRITKDTGTPGDLVASNIAVTDLVFQKAANSNSDGVRVVLELTGTKGDQTKTVRLQSFAVLRGSY